MKLELEQYVNGQMSAMEAMLVVGNACDDRNLRQLLHAGLEAIEQEKKNVQRQVDRLENEVADLEDENDSLESTIEKLELKICGLENQLEELQAENKLLRERGDDTAEKAG